jgi:hypothetical protein
MSYCLADRRYSRELERSSEEAERELAEAMERERLLRDKPHAGRAEEPRRD